MKHLLRIGSITIAICIIFTIVTKAQNKINSYQYWIDSDYHKSVLASVAPSEQLEFMKDIPLGTIKDGLHVFTIRFKDDIGWWSIPVNQFFYYRNVANNDIQSYQYWFDNDFTNNTQVSVTPSKELPLIASLPIETFKEGLHIFSIRFKDGKGKWSIPVNQFIYKSNNIPDNEITSYRYWINDNIENAIYVTVSNPTQLFSLNDEVNIPEFENGEYTIHFQFKDASGKWSLVTSDNFVLNDLTAIDNTFLKEINAYPNPTNGLIHIDLDFLYKLIEIEVFDGTGKIVRQYTKRNQQSFEININSNSPGVYFIKIAANEKQATFQFVKK